MRRRVLEAVPMLLLAAAVLAFGALSPSFLDPRNLVNILIQAASLAIIATGLTFVLLTGGIDLSVGASMFLAAAVAGKMVLAGLPLAAALVVVLLVGAAFGALNAFVITRGHVLPFVVTLATLYIGRGAALYVTETRAMNLPDELLRLGTGRLLGVPAPVWVLALVLLVAQTVLARTPYGRRLYALGRDAHAARQAGLPVARLTASVYVVSGLLAALGGLVAVAQLGAVSPTFGTGREFAAIAAAVLGGTSLFGGRGSVFPGALLGAALIQTVESGLVTVNADPYLYPLVLAAIIFLAVLLDSLRHRQLEAMARRRIRAA